MRRLRWWSRATRVMVSAFRRIRGSRPKPDTTSTRQRSLISCPRPRRLERCRRHRGPCRDSRITSCPSYVVVMATPRLKQRWASVSSHRDCKCRPQAVAHFYVPFDTGCTPFIMKVRLAPGSGPCDPLDVDARFARIANDGDGPAGRLHFVLRGDDEAVSVRLDGLARLARRHLSRDEHRHDRAGPSDCM